MIQDQNLNSNVISYLYVEAQASDETVLSRLKERENSEESFISDARREDFEHFDSHY